MILFGVAFSSSDVDLISGFLHFIIFNGACAHQFGWRFAPWIFVNYGSKFIESILVLLEISSARRKQFWC